MMKMKMRMMLVNMCMLLTRVVMRLLVLTNTYIIICIVRNERGMNSFFTKKNLLEKRREGEKQRRGDVN